MKNDHKFLVRLTPEEHETLKKISLQEKISYNQVLRKALDIFAKWIEKINAIQL